MPSPCRRRTGRAGFGLGPFLLLSALLLLATTGWGARARVHPGPVYLLSLGLGGLLGIGTTVWSISCSGGAGLVLVGKTAGITAWQLDLAQTLYAWELDWTCPAGG